MENNFNLLQRASEQFLTEAIPDNWYAMTEEEQDEFIDDHVWEPFEDYPPSYVCEQIDRIAKTYKFLITETNNGK